MNQPLDLLVDELEALLALAERTEAIERQRAAERAAEASSAPIAKTPSMLGLSAPAPRARRHADPHDRPPTGPQPRTGTGTQLGVGSVSGSSPEDQ